MSISSKTVICTLKISNWLGNKTDSEITDKLADDKKASRDRVKVVKKLIDPTILNKMNCLITQVRNYRKNATVCWGDSGDRLLSVRKLEKYREKMMEFKDEFEELRQQMVEVLPQAKEDARKDLGTAWKEKDYPTQEELKNKFGFYSRILPVPTGTDDVRLEGYSDSAMAEVHKEMLEAKNNQVAVATADCKNRLKEYLGGYASKLQNNKKLHQSLSDNLKDLLDLLDSFSFLDHELAKQIADARKLVVDIDLVRNDDGLKASKIQEAKNILKVFT